MTLINITWIIAILAVISLSVGIVSTIVVKTEITPNWKKIGKVLIWILGLIIFRFLLWGVVSYYRENNDRPTRKPATVSAVGEIQPVQPREEWVFIWNLPPGQYDRGLNSNTLEVRIEKNDSESLWFDTPYEYYGGIELGHYLLSKSGDSFVGSWSQENPKDGGHIYLKKVGQQTWVGQCTDRSSRSFACTLKRK